MIVFFQPVNHSCHLWFHLSAVMIASWAAWIMSAACKHAHSHTHKAGYLIYIPESHNGACINTQLTWCHCFPLSARDTKVQHPHNNLFSTQNHLPRWDVVSYQTHWSRSKCDHSSTLMERCVSCRNEEHWASERDRQTDRDGDREKYGVLRGRLKLKLQPEGGGGGGHCPFCPNKPHQDSWHEVQGIDISSRYAVCCPPALRKGTGAVQHAALSVSTAAGVKNPAKSFVHSFGRDCWSLYFQHPETPRTIGCVHNLVSSWGL